MVNYRRVVCEVALLAAAVAVVSAAPAYDDKEQHKLIYDQRQNGSENYRLSIDGVVIAVAPAESFLSALSDIDFSDLIDFESLEEELRPKPPAPSPEPTTKKPDEKPLLEAKPEKPADATDVKPLDMPESKPQDVKPETLSNLDDVSMEPAVGVKGHKKSAVQKRQETTQRLKHRLANIFLPFLRKRRHQ